MGTVKNRTLSLVVLSLSFSGCATTDSDSNLRTEIISTARSRCMELARSSGYKEVAIDSVERDGQAEWKVALVVNKDGKNQKETCEYNASTNRVRLG
jgi:hypothetical protein